VSITIELQIVPRHSEPLLLVTFEDLPEQRVDEKPRPPMDAVSEANLIDLLEAELKSTQEDLQTRIEEQESANEELQAANEEVMSINEELQAANEELEASKEELTSHPCTTTRRRPRRRGCRTSS
jgi:two-component system CheB/CheR fusion protein